MYSFCAVCPLIYAGRQLCRTVQGIHQPERQGHLPDAFYATCTVPIALCDREHVLVSRGFGLPNGAPLSAAVQRMLTACHEPRGVVETLQITQASPLQAAAFVPILSRDNVAGGLLIGQAHEPPGEDTLTTAALVTRMIAAQLL